ncbi:MAG: amidohydrolase [Alteromonadaceae bacterium]|nr:amidohydrolase [Alteromonadaceae bacterium]
MKSFRRGRRFIKECLPQVPRRFKHSIAICFGALFAHSVLAQPTADLVVKNADVYTSDPNQPRVQAFAVKAGRFLSLGTNALVESYVGENTEVIDAKGASVTAGFVDSHSHLEMGTTRVVGVDLYGVASKQEWLERVAAVAARLDDGEWVVGGGWDYTLAEGKYPSKEDLDAVVNDRVVVLQDKDLHSVWVNSYALKLAGITADTKVPQGGEIVLDDKTGEPTGILKEGASHLLTALAPHKSKAEKLADLKAVFTHANSRGITTVHNMGGPGQALDYVELAEQDELTMRVWYGQFSGSNYEVDRAAKSRQEIHRRMAATGLEFTRGPLVEMGFIKTIIDGVLSTHTAYLMEPYSDKPGWRGKPFRPQESLEKLISYSNANGFPVAVHAIGDAGVDTVVSAFENAALPITVPNRIEHLEIVKPDAILRMKQAGIVASMQPDHAAGVVGKYIRPRVGEEREKFAYAWRQFLDADVKLVFSADYPTTPLNPLMQIKDALYRESPWGLGGPWHTENAVTFGEALQAYTQSGADITRWGNQIGSITPGKWADFVIFNDAFPNPADRSIEHQKVVATYLAGKKIYPVE